MTAMNGYTDSIRRWAMDTRRVGDLPDADGTGEVGLGAGEAGQRLAVRFAIRVKQSRVAEVRFQVFGCGFTIAACAAAAELAAGRPLAEVLAIGAATVDVALDGLPPERGYCAELAVEALHAAVASACRGAGPVQTSLHPPGDEEQTPRVSAADPRYRILMGSPAPAGVANEDRHLFACLLSVAAQDPHEPAAALGLTPDAVDTLLETFFPGVDGAVLADRPTPAPGVPPQINDEVLAILLSHVPRDDSGRAVPASLWLARALAARAAHPGHLWSAMGLFARPELSAAIRRHLPTLAAANHKGMRWKRYLFKQVCDLHGAVLCKAPDCGLCSDYALCFAPD